LLVEDDPPIRRFLRTTLPTQDYELIEADSGKAGLAQATSQNPDVILLDLGLPDMDGIDFIRNVREWSSVPIIIISARGQERDKIAALDAGADDYLTKPFGIGELLARIRAALRRLAQIGPEKTDGVVILGDVRIDLEKRQVFRGENEVRLTPLEYKLLTVLVRNRGRVVTQRQLLQEVWGPSHVDQNHYLRIFTLQLRRKLESDPARPRLILTEAGVGYRLVEV